MSIKKFISAILIIILVFASAGICFGQKPTIAHNLEAVLAAAGDSESVPVIIHLADQVDLKPYMQEKNKTLRRSAIINALKEKKDKSQKKLLSFLKDNKVKKPETFWIFNGIAAELPAHLIRKLAVWPEISQISLDSEITVPEIMPAALAAPEWNIDAIRAPELWALGYDGTGVVVATMDSGIDYLHPDLGPKWRGGTNSWFDPYGEHQAPYDKTGHGTGVMGVILGGDAGGSAIGVAPGAQWIAVKIFNDNGTGDVSAIHAGFQWLLDPDGDPGTDDGPDVVNNSWFLQNTVDQCNTEFVDDIAALKAAETAVVFAAGNSGPSAASSVSPANNPGNLSVGAADSLLYVDGQSSRGPSACEGYGVYPTLTAPGIHIRTADLTLIGTFLDSYITVLGGTSFAAPHVSGTMALLFSAIPGLSVSRLESALKSTALDLEVEGPDNTSGYGLVDPMEAYLELSRVSIAPVLMLLLGD